MEKVKNFIRRLIRIIKIYKNTIHLIKCIETSFKHEGLLFNLPNTYEAGLENGLRYCYSILLEENYSVHHNYFKPYKEVKDGL